VSWLARVYVLPKAEVLDPIEGLTPDEQAHGLDYLGLMRQNLRALRGALGCR